MFPETHRRRNGSFSLRPHRIIRLIRRRHTGIVCLLMMCLPSLATASSPPLPEITLIDSDLPNCAQADDSPRRELMITNDCEIDITLIQYLEDESAEPNTLETIVPAGDTIFFRPDVDDPFIWEVITWRTDDGGQGQIELDLKFVVYSCPTMIDCLGGCQVGSEPSLDWLVIFGGLFLYTARVRRRRFRQSNGGS